MSLDPRTPVLVGSGQIQQKPDDPLEALEPIDLMSEALVRAAEDAGAPGLLGAADSIRVTQGLWPYTDPGALLRERFGADGAETVLAPLSGNVVQGMINEAFRQIEAGQRDVVLIAGGEAEHSKRRLKAAGRSLAMTEQTGAEPDRGFGAGGEELVEKTELELGIAVPYRMYSVLENALRHHRGEGLEAHRVRVSELWARFSAVAAGNPNAWIREAVSAEAIRNPAPANRMLAWPYTKRMTANMVVDQAAGLIVCSVGAARRFGVPEHRWVHLHAGTEAKAGYYTSNRLHLHDQPALGLAGRRALELAGVGPDELDFVDLYSCFPVAVQIAAAELGLSLDRALTITGGLTFGGGPFNSYAIHSTAEMLDCLREKPGSTGLVTSVGGYISKLAFGVYSTRPAEGPVRHADLTEEAAVLPRRELVRDHEGAVTVESYALLYEGGEEPDRAVVAALLEDGRRTWARIQEPSLLGAMTREELIGRRAVVEDGVLHPD